MQTKKQLGKPPHGLSDQGAEHVAVDPERRAIFILLAKATNTGALDAHEEARLRRLMEPHNRLSPKLSWEELLSAGRFMCGVWLTMEPETLDIETIDPSAVA